MAKRRIEQAKRLRAKASDGGLKFEAYLTPNLAQWVLSMVEQGDFVDLSEAVFVFMQQARELEQYKDLKVELLKRRLVEAEKGESLSSEDVRAHIEELKNKVAAPVIWEKVKN